MASTRRRYLRDLGGGPGLLLGGSTLLGSAGCLGRDPPNDGGDDDETRPSGTGGPGVAVVSVDGDDDLPVAPSVDVVREAATESSPPRLRTTLENAGDETVTVGEGRAVHLEHVSDETGALVFLPSEREFPAEPGCWRLTDRVAVDGEYRTFEVEAGASSSRRVDLYGMPGEDACLPVGEYRFETTVSVGEPGSDPEQSGRWSLTVLLE